MDILPNDERLRKVRVILFNAPCSKSGVASAIDYVLQEGTACVHDLVNGVESSKLHALVMKHRDILKHAMKFLNVRYIVYSTNSVYKSENEDTISKVIEDNRMENINKGHNPFVVSTFLPDLSEKLRTFQVNPTDEKAPFSSKC